MNQCVRRALLVLGLSGVFSCMAVAQRPIVGGYKPADTDDAEVVAAAEFAVSEQGKKQETPITLVSVEKAERQVVAGMNFRLCLKVEVDDEEQTVKIVVFRSLQKAYQLKSWEEGSCEEAEGAHATLSLNSTSLFTTWKAIPGWYQFRLTMP